MRDPNTAAPNYRPGRMGHVQYARMLAILHRSPITAPEMHTALGRHGKPWLTGVNLWRMSQLGLAHIASWQPPQGRAEGALVPVFAFGQGINRPYPGKVGTRNQRPNLAKRYPRPELITFAAIVRELRDGATREQIHERCGISEDRLCVLVRAMRELGLVRISGWIRKPGRKHPQQVLMLGAGADAPKPLAKKRRRLGWPMSRSTVFRAALVERLAA